MNQKRFSVYIVGAVIVLLGLYTVVAYNDLVKKQEKVQQMWSEVQTTYQRRLDLTPNLVSVVKGVSDFEQNTFTQIAAARAHAQSAAATNTIDAASYQNQSQAQDNLAAASNRLIAVVEKYPTLKGTSAYLGLQTQLEGNERRIKVARKDFNEAVADYNQAVRGFPKSMVAAVLGFTEKKGFEAVSGADKNVAIKF